MRITNKYFFRTLTAIFLWSLPAAVVAGPDEYKANSRYDYYTLEKTAEVILWVPAHKAGAETTASLLLYGSTLLEQRETAAGQINSLPVDMEGLAPGSNTLELICYEYGKAVASMNVEVVVRQHRYNEVKIDRMNGGLVVEGLPFYPFGFYTYSPVQEGLAADEVVKGFNMMSPYQEISSKGLKERKAYMDRCAALGMKVHYNLLSLAGGGGVGHGTTKGMSAKKRMHLLRKEVETFRNHPALLAWYISDEPVGQGVPPDSLEKAYSLIKELDPYHPVSMVFMSPHMAHEYSSLMDIVMADPYPIPHGSVMEVAQTTAMLAEEFFMDKAVWIVPQAFGGNEWWEREPTRRELRAMTYLALVNNAMGIQYFIRQGPNAFPKSTMAWDECGAMALEFAALNPYVFSDEPAPGLIISQGEVSGKAYHKGGEMIIVAVNASPRPISCSFTLEDFGYYGNAMLMFENRNLQVVDGKLEDMIDGYGTRVYKIKYKTRLTTGARPHPKNIARDGSFELMAGNGIPSACYARPQGDKGATYFTDSRTAAHGIHSLRMTTPEYAEGMALSFYNITVEPGKSYTVSIQARALPYKYRRMPENGLLKRLCGCTPDGDEYPEFRLGLGTGHAEYFIPGREWEEYSFSCVPLTAGGKWSVSPALELTGTGTAWFDLLQVYPDMSMNTRVSRESNNVDVFLSSTHAGADIYYSTDGSKPRKIKYKGLFTIERSCMLRAAAFIGDEQVGYIQRHVEISMATGRYVEYKHKYSPKYNAGYKDGLVDGILATPNFKDGRWQGFEGDNMDVTLNLKSIRRVKEIALRFLRNESAWIFLPGEVRISWSADGKEYYSLDVSPAISADMPAGKGINTFTYSIPEGIGARYIRIHAKNMGTCPEGHPGAGGKAWLFTDEVIVR